MKKLLLFTLTFLLVCGFSMAQQMKMSPKPSDGGASVGIRSYFSPLSPTATESFSAPVVPSDGSTSGNTRCPGNTYKYQRTEYLITAAEMASSGFLSGYTVDGIGFTVATAGGTSQAGAFNVYLRNTTDATYTLGATWTTTGFTQTSSIASWTVPIALGPYIVNFTGGSPFTYTGGGVYVAWEFANAGTAGATALVGDCNSTGLVGGLYGYRGATLGTALAVSNFRPTTVFVTNSVTDIVNLSNIYTYEKVPVGYGTPTPINVRVANVSASAATFNVTITVKDPTNTITRFTSTQTVTALAANTAQILTFTGWNPTILENANITASTSVISGETVVLNNTKTIQSSVNTTTMGYDFSNAGPSGFGFTYPGTGLFASKFTMNGTGSVLGANLLISPDAASTGNSIYAVVMNSAGLILDQSASYTILATDLGVNKFFSFPVPPSLTNTDYYVAMAQTAGAAQWYPIGTLDETPARTNTFYTAAITGGALTILPATFNLKYGIEAVIGTPPAVNNPSVFVATPFSGNQINLGWALNANSNNVLVAWSATGTFGTPVNGSTYTAGSAITGGGTVLQYNNLTSFSHTGLTPATQYYYKAWSYNGSVYSSGTISNAKTPCVSSPAPWTEDFELATFPPGCWSAVAGSASWLRSSTVSAYGTGTGSAFADFYNTSGATPFKLMTLPFSNGSLTAPTLKFDYAYATYATEIDEMDVYYSTNGGTTFTLLLAMPGGLTGILNTGGATTTAFVPTAAQWATKSITLPAGTNMVSFYGISAFGNNLYLDNVKVVQGYNHDVGVVNINPAKDVFNAGSVTPVATVSNSGGNTETFTVNMTIGAYTSTKTVTALAPGTSTLVTFDAWTAAVGDYTMTVTTTLASDEFAGNNTASKPVKVMVLNKQVYGYTTFTTTNNGPISFNLNNPGVITEIVNDYPATYPAAGTWANGVWYATIYAAAAPFNLVTFNTTTGARSVIGDMGVNINAMSYNTANSTMYGAGYDGTNSNLYTINLTTGAATLVGSIGARLIINMAINNAGACYVTDLSTSTLGTLNLGTGAFTTVGPVGFSVNYAQDMEFDRETGELYMAAYGSTGELRWVNKTTGNTLLVGQFQGGAEVTGFAIPYSSNKTLNLTSVMLEGLYAGAGTMNPAYDENGLHWPAGVADHITVELHNAANYASIAFSANVALSTTGAATVTVPAANSGSYYITVRHRNSLQTVSATAVSFAGSTITQSFGSPAVVFGGNVVLMAGPGTHYAIYGGDVNQDDIIDVSDFIAIDNLAALASAGYLPEDANGDGLIDLGDFIVVDNNAALAVGAVTP